MDPDACLAEIRNVVDSAIELGFYSDLSMATIMSIEELGAKVKALDEWLTTGGALPTVWCYEIGDSLRLALKTEYARHVNLGPKQMVFNIRCTCGYIGQTVSRRGDWDEHVSDAVALALKERGLAR